jgi:glucokinase
LRLRTFNSFPHRVSGEFGGPGRPGLLRQVNAAEILRLVRERGPCSRADLARQSGLSVPTVSSSIEYLQKKGLIEAMGTGGSSGGRPPALVQFNRSYGYVIGVDIGGSAVRVALADLDGGVIGKVNLPIRERGTPPRVVAMIRNGVARLQKAHGVKRKELLAIAAGAPGITDSRAGIVRSAPHLTGWENVPLQRMISEKLDLPAAIENDVNLGALGESWRGTARGVPDFVFIGIGTGVGAGVFLDGHLYHGSDWTAGEIGYLMVPGTRPGPLDILEPGPLEAVIGGRGIETAWRQANGRRQPRQAMEILDRAATGDPLARTILDRTARVLAEGILNLGVILNPRLIVFGGRIGTHPALFEATQRIVKNSRVAVPQLSSSILGQEAQLLGAVWLAMRLAEARLLGSLSGWPGKNGA